MAEAALPPRWHEIVRRHFADTVGYVVAQTGKCLDIQSQESKAPEGRVRGRDFQPLHPQDLPRLQMPPSWVIGIILCPDDDLSLYRDWYEGLDPKDRDRVVMFFHPTFAADASDKTWLSTNLPLPRTQRFNGSWEDFHHQFGRRHGDRVYEDHLPGAPR